MQFSQNLETFLSLNVVGLSLQPFIPGHGCFFPSPGILRIHGLMQQRRERDDIVGVLQLLLRNFGVRAALGDDVMILIAAARTAKPLDYKCYIRRVLDEIAIARKFLIIATHLKFFEAVWAVFYKLDRCVGVDLELFEFGNRV